MISDQKQWNNWRSPSYYSSVQCDNVIVFEIVISKRSKYGDNKVNGLWVENLWFSLNFSFGNVTIILLWNLRHGSHPFRFELGGGLWVNNCTPVIISSIMDNPSVAAFDWFVINGEISLIFCICTQYRNIVVVETRYLSGGGCDWMNSLGYLGGPADRLPSVTLDWSVR